MAVNRLKIKINNSQDENLDKVLVIPIPQTTDEVGRGDLIDEYERETIERLLHLKKDYEVIRYTQAPLIGGDPSPNMVYNFNFGVEDPNTPGPVYYNNVPEVTMATTWNDAGTSPCPQQLEAIYGMGGSDPELLPDGITVAPILTPSLYPTFPPTWYGYDAAGFSAEEAYRNEKSFVKSFFKLDLYDSPIRNNQKLYISIILNPINSEKIYRPTLNNSCPADALADGRWNCKPYGDRWVPTPHFNLDPFGNNDGYYIYWLKDDKFLDINDFYMSAKFYNGKTGVITSFINQSQNTLPNPFNFTPENFSYYKITLDRINYTYTMFDSSNNRAGIPSNPIIFWQYINKG